MHIVHVQCISIRSFVRSSPLPFDNSIAHRQRFVYCRRFFALKMNCLICGFHKLHDMTTQCTHREVQNLRTHQAIGIVEKIKKRMKKMHLTKMRKKHVPTLYLHLVIDTHQQTDDINFMWTVIHWTNLCQFFLPCPLAACI